MRRTILLLATTAIALVLASGVALAAAVLDQKQTSGEFSFTLSDSKQRFAQTFTAGATGKLTGVSVLVGCCTRIDQETRTPVNDGNPPGDLILKVFAVDGSGFPTGAALSTKVVPEENFPVHDEARDWMRVRLRPAVSVQAETRYALVMTSETSRPAPDDFKYKWGADNQDPYKRGFVSYKLGKQPWSTEPIEPPMWDHAFKTFVVVAE